MQRHFDAFSLLNIANSRLKNQTANPFFLILKYFMINSCLKRFEIARSEILSHLSVY